MSKTIEEKSATPRPKRCGKYAPGHEVHWIPGIRFAGENKESVFILFGEDESIELHWLGWRKRYFNHELARLKAVVQNHGQANVGLNVQRSLLYVSTSSNSSYVFYLSQEPICECD
jgi:hypothetical protein